MPWELQTGLSRLELGRTLNLLQVGESVAQDVCAKLALLCDEEDYRNHAVAPAMDEARHHAAFVRFLKKIGFEDWDDLDPILVGTLDGLLETDDVTELVVTEQFILESLAMPLFEQMAAQAVNPLFRNILTLIRGRQRRP